MRCTACGQENPEGFRFCGACGAVLEALAQREERKVVTVLFADLVGFTSRAEQMDPEDVRALLAPYHARLREELERFGGTVEKFIGDAVMALFGAPVAHEDDPERAVRAALAIRDWAREKERLPVRIAVNTGEALVVLGARPEAGEGMASGDVVNTTARLQSAAPINGVLVGETTYRATRQVIDYAEHEPVVAKGKAEPIPSHEAVEARSRFGIDVRQHGGAPLIGRDRELETLVGAFERSKDERSPELVTIVGAAGIGKSRLVYELFRAIERGTTLAYWRQGRSLPYGEGVSFSALAEIVKAHAGIREDDTPDRAGDRIAQTVHDLVPQTEAQWLESHLRPLAGLSSTELDLGDRREEAFAAWRRFFELMARHRPLVLVFDDLQWADDSSLDFVDQLVDRIRNVPLLVVVTARTDLLERRPNWSCGKLNATTINLSPLRDQDTVQLIGALLDQTVLLAETQTALLERAGGNPLYAEQFARLYQERGAVDEAALPESVQGIIAARLDGLAAEEKKLLQAAAVIGKVFWLGALRTDRGAARAALHSLERRDFVRRERRSAVDGDEEYVFRHLLVRDVAYAQIPRAGRANKHRLAAEWIESLGRPEDHAEMLAHHYLEALAYARAAGEDTNELIQPARLSLRDAGERAVGLHSPGVAAQFFEQALELWPPDDSALPELLFSFGRALRLVDDDRAPEVLERARDSLIGAGRTGRAAAACAQLSELWWYRAQPERARGHLELARELVQSEPASPSKGSVLAQIARLKGIAGESSEAVAAGREAVTMAEELELEEMTVDALTSVGTARCAAGDLGGVADLERAIEVGVATNSPGLARAYNNLATVMRNRFADTSRAGELFRAALQAAERFGNTTMARFVRTSLIYDDYHAGKWDDFLTEARGYLADSARSGGSYQDAAFLASIAEIALARGDETDARIGAIAAVDAARRVGDPQVVRAVLEDVALIEARLGDLDAGRRYAIECLADGYLAAGLALVADRLDIADELRAVADAQDPRSRWATVTRLLLDGDCVGAAALLDELHRPNLSAYARLLAADHLLAAGRRSEAEEQLTCALAFFRSAGATRYVREAEALLAATA